MGTLYIDRRGVHVKLDGNAIALYADGSREGAVPIKPLSRVVVVGSVTLDSSVLHRLAAENIAVLFLSGKRLAFKGMLHGRLHNNGLLRTRQYACSLSEGFRLCEARALVSRKLKAQAEFLDLQRERRPDLRAELTVALRSVAGSAGKAEHAGDMEGLRGLEGAAAAAYFRAFVQIFPSSLGFRRRTRRPPTDPVNAMLSLCYTMLHFEMVREIEIAGLDPTIGFYHAFEYGRESLACDLVEAWRPRVDALVHEMFRSRRFRAEDFSRDLERPGVYLKKQGRMKFYTAYVEWSREMAPLWRSDVRGLVRRIEDVKDVVSA
ncbi:MAG: CRISPR-associated endonuclease Cas1 [Thermodesulfovibrionales bacterium]